MTDHTLSISAALREAQLQLCFTQCGGDAEGVVSHRLAFPKAEARCLMLLKGGLRVRRLTNHKELQAAD